MFPSAEVAQVSSPVYRFGDFQLDCGAFELLRKGHSVRVERKPMELLILLASRPGQLVTRTEIAGRLWSSEVFVDTEHGINTAVRKLRYLLRDDPETPQFIQTVTGRGYRFIAQIATVEPESTPLPPTSEVQQQSGSDSANPSQSKPLAARRRPAIVWLIGFGLVFVLAAAVLLAFDAGGWRDRFFPRTSRIEALAVLPLGNLSNDPTQEYFSDGMTDAITTELGMLGGPRVISRQSTMQFKGSKASLQEIARKLNVDGVIEGTVERFGDRVRISVRLTKADPERQLWADEYDRDIRDVLAVQADIARAVAREVRVKLSQEEKRSLGSRRPVDPQAHKEYLQGLYDADRSNYDAAIAHLKNSIQRDPTFAPAYAALADTYFWQGHPENNGPSVVTVLPLARAAAEKALQLDPSLGQTHLVLGELATADYNWGEAEAQYKEAIRLDPSCSECHHQYGALCQSQGRHDAAIAEVEKAVELDPLSPGLRNQLGLVAVTSRNYQEAITQFESLHQDAWIPPLATSYMELGRFPEALAATRKCENSDPGEWCLIVRANIYSRWGKKAEAEKILDQFRKTAHQRYVFPSTFFRLYQAVGDKEQALYWLERAYQEKDPSLFWLRFDWLSVDPSGEILRSEPRFLAVYRKLNFPP
jgi:TolB-like protein/DNA-binding winged helix-turn-helix (wHTH) protein